MARSRNSEAEVRESNGPYSHSPRLPEIWRMVSHDHRIKFKQTSASSQMKLAGAWNRDHRPLRSIMTMISIEKDTEAHMEEVPGPRSLLREEVGTES